MPFNEVLQFVHIANLKKNPGFEKPLAGICKAILGNFAVHSEHRLFI
jgi:hypothetical protein